MARKHFMLPKPVYELLPALYVLGGIAAMSTVESYLSFISGLLMGIAGVAVLLLRRNYRAKLAPFRDTETAS